MFSESWQNPAKIFAAAEKTAAQSPNWDWTEEEKVGESARLRARFESADDEYVYRSIVAVTFFAGFQVKIVESKLPAIYEYFGVPGKAASYTKGDIGRILKDEKLIRNERKIRACWENAKKILKIAEELGSVKEWVLGFGAYDDSDGLEKLIHALSKSKDTKFHFIGPRTVYHLLTEWGFDVVKPDRMVMRILSRLRLIPSEHEVDWCIDVCRRFARETGYSIRYVDFVFVSIGQVGQADICRDRKPRCWLCYLRRFCEYYSSGVRMNPSFGKAPQSEEKVER